MGCSCYGRQVLTEDACDATAEEKDSSLIAVLDPPTSTCDDPLASTNDGINILFVVTDVLGCVYYLGASFNAITFTTCVMAVGFCVDYSVPSTAPRSPCAVYFCRTSLTCC